MSTVSIPPFPSQDLAKLVLGYLAEEQLMTAYDEFLQASPYLDALRNEYDRIFMTSLKNILAEYRAVKIYVESCKPVALRRLLFGCANLLEVVKFLIQNIDLNKLQPHEPNRTKDSSANTSANSASILSKLTECDVCNSLRLKNCACKSKSGVSTQSTSCFDAVSDTSVETTALEDLPGNHNQVKKMHVKLLEKVSKASITPSSGQNIDILSTSKECQDRRTVSSFDQNATITINCNTQIQSTRDGPVPHSASVKNHIEQLRNPDNSREKIEEFNNILKTVCSTSKAVDNKNVQISSAYVENSRLSTGTFQEFSSGVYGNEGVLSKPMPDSSTSENSTQLTVSKEVCNKNFNHETPENNEKPLTKATILLKVGNVNTVQNEVKKPCQIRPKQAEQKVTILSDIKVDKMYHSESNTTMPPVLKNATSTPLMQMQTIVINGTPAYKQDTKNMKLAHYTKDEIMAMPTIILVPTSGPPNMLSQSQSISSNATVNSSMRCLGPLMIDVSSNNIVKETNSTEVRSLPSLDEQNESVPKKTVAEVLETKNASMPKDMTENLNKCTPHSLPPARKSSSTPRRNSHVRVLDFTTPRRILQDTINEHSEQNSNDVEITISKSPDFNAFANEVSSEKASNYESEILKSNSNIVDSTCKFLKENQDTNKISLKKNWDADLRVLVGNQRNPIENTNETPGKLKVKRKSKKKQLSETDKDCNKIPEEKPMKKLRKKTTKNNKKMDEVIEETPVSIQQPAVLPIKPTINIITDWSMPPEEDKEKVDKGCNKSNDDQMDTPDVDRLSLQNAIGAKLNISDLLETPYKQALYDIQMETPRFLGPDLPGEPLSDIKIMNIPTPRFLSSPKQSQPTPSSYSSRPTDYSSGGSYYKPEDQDYMRVDDLEYPEPQIEKEKLTNKKCTANENDSQLKNSRSSRPVRTCTKNVSYRSNTKTKDLLDKSEVTSETSSRNSSCVKTDDEKPKATKDKKLKTQSKKSTSISKKRKTPVKKESKSFIKIKPRRVTPVKDESRSKRRVSESQNRKKSSNKDKSVNVAPVPAVIPTKSRRKSSTPRKLHCTKPFTSESSGQDSPDMINNNKNIGHEPNLPIVQDSDTEQLPLRWSDDGSQDTKSKVPDRSVETDDIIKIQEFIAKSEISKPVAKENESHLHIDLVKRGFDIETAKIIERDLLDIPSSSKTQETEKNNEAVELRPSDVSVEKMTQSDTSTSVNLHIDEDKEISNEEDDEIQLSVHECNEETENYFIYHHNGNAETPDIPVEKLKDKFTMEVCIDDGVAIRLKASPFSLLLDQDPKDLETEMAVNSISNIERLYTPMKDPVRAQCYEIFDSTLTSLDTPLKISSPRRKEHAMMVTEIVLEVEKEEIKEAKSEVKKRKRKHSDNASEDSNESKKSKAEPQYLLNPANIQNIDIETVLSKLHGP